MPDRRRIMAPSMRGHVLGRSKESSQAKRAHGHGGPIPVDSHTRRKTMAQLVVDDLVQLMVDAAEEAAGRQWEALRRRVRPEFTNLAETAMEVERRKMSGDSSEEQAATLMRMHMRRAGTKPKPKSAPLRLELAVPSRRTAGNRKDDEPISRQIVGPARPTRSIFGLSPMHVPRSGAPALAKCRIACRAERASRAGH